MGGVINPSSMRKELTNMDVVPSHQKSKGNNCRQIGWRSVTSQKNRQADDIRLARPPVPIQKRRCPQPTHIAWACPADDHFTHFVLRNSFTIGAVIPDRTIGVIR